MAHDIIIILDDIDTLMGNADSGQMYDLRAAVVAANNYLLNSETEPDPLGDSLHEVLHELQEFLEDGTNMSEGAVDVIGTFTEDINNLLP